MSKNENIVAVVDALGETIQKQKDDIFFKELQIAELKTQLAEAEKELKEAIKTIDNQTATIKDFLKEAAEKQNDVKAAATND